jgi:hypothetical protein
MVQVPAATIVTVVLLSVQAEAVSDAKLTGSPDDAVALTAKGAAPNVFPASEVKVML